MSGRACYLVCKGRLLAVFSHVIEQREEQVLLSSSYTGTSPIHSYDLIPSRSPHFCVILWKAQGTHIWNTCTVNSGLSHVWSWLSKVGGLPSLYFTSEETQLIPSWLPICRYQELDSSVVSLTPNPHASHSIISRKTNPEAQPNRWHVPLKS